MALADEPAIAEVPPFSGDRARRARRRRRGVLAPPTPQRVKAIERTTNHDVKAVEYWLKERFAGVPEVGARRASSSTSRARRRTSTTSRTALMLAEARRDVLLPALRRRSPRRCARSRTRTPTLPMLSRTHGQPATPTTLGKEMANVVARLERAARARIARVPLKGKINGAVGNYNAHVVAYPDFDWERARRARRRRRSASSSIRTPRRSSRTTAWPNCSTRSPAPTRS